MTRPVKYAATPFGDIAYTEQGDGLAALFVHGIFLNGYLWRHVIDRVADARRCIAIDLMAHGATRTALAQDISFKAQAQMLEAFCIALDLDAVDLVSNDSGSGIAQIFAANHPQRVRSLTLTNGAVHDNWPPEAFAPMRRLIDQGQLGKIGKRWLEDIEFVRAGFGVAYEHPERLSMETVQTYFEPLFSTPEAVRNLERWFGPWHDCIQTVEVEPSLRRLQTPTLAVWATDDVFFPLKSAYWLREAIPGCREVVELEGAKLYFPEERPDALADALCKHWQIERAEAGT